MTDKIEKARSAALARAWSADAQAERTRKAEAAWMKEKARGPIDDDHALSVRLRRWRNK